MTSFWRIRPEHSSSSDEPGPSPVVVVMEDSMPHRRREHDMAERSVMRDEVDQAVEIDKRRGRVRFQRILMFVVVAIVIATIVDISCHDNVRTWLETSFDWIEENPKAGELFVVGTYDTYSYIRLQRK